MTKYYLAYGSNLNKEQMALRCPTAKPLETTILLKDYELVFRGEYNFSYLTIEPCKGKCVPLGVWKVLEEDEVSLDIYEGYPHLYDKKAYEFELDGSLVKGFIYVMRNEYDIAYPSYRYYLTCEQGYVDFGFDSSFLKEALSKCN